MYPGAERVDGSGGDHGRDVQLRSGDELTIWQVKAFPDRLNKSKTRKSQIKKSLDRAAKLNPTRWHLVAPMAPNSSELAWYDKLRENYPFVAEWRDRTWLDQEFAKHPDLVRYAKSVSEELLDRAAQYKLEKEVLAGGVPDLIERHADLDTLADEISPHYRARIVAGRDGAQAVTFEAKHDEAPPITIEADLSLPDDATVDSLRDALRDAIGFGRSVDVPGEYVASVRVNGPPELKIGQNIDRVALLRIIAIPEDIALPAVVSIVGPAGLPLARLRFTLTKRTSGTNGAQLTGWDPARTAELTVRLDQTTGNAILNVAGNPDTGPILPSALLPALRFFAASQAPNRVLVTIGGTPLADPSPCPAQPLDHIARVTQAAEDLAAIQDHLHDPFPVPALNPRLADLLTRLRRLLDGEQVAWRRGTMSWQLDAGRVAEFLADIGTANHFTFAADTPTLRVQIGDTTVEVGPIRFYAAEAEISSIQQLRRVKPSDPDPAVDIHPLGDGWIYAQLLDAAENG